MKEALQRQLDLPAGVNSQTHQIMTLAEVLANPWAAFRTEDLSIQDRLKLVATRWQAPNEWQPLILGTDGELNLARALEEIQKQSRLGVRLMEVTLRVIEMAREDVTKAMKEERP